MQRYKKDLWQSSNYPACGVLAPHHRANAPGVT
jgi:hypothetical protein